MKYPFEEFLKEMHAKNYMGTDDDMVESFETWITDLDCEDLIGYANAFGHVLMERIDREINYNKKNK